MIRKAETRKLREERFIDKVVEMHYKQGLSQQEIAELLDVSRATISRTLTKAKKEGYVEIRINNLDSSRISMEEDLEKKFNLKEAVVASNRKDEDIGDTIAFYATDYLLRVIKNHMTVAMSRGVTLQKMITSLEKDVRRRFLKLKDVNVVPLEGATNVLTTIKKEYRLAYSNYMTEETARLLNGKGYEILAPQFVSSPAVRDIFVQEKSVKDVLQMAASADIAFVGIGTTHMSKEIVNSMFQNGVSVRGKYKHMARKGGVGEIIGHVIDKQGNMVNDAIEDSLICLELEKFKKIPIRVGVAYGMEKAEAILSTLRGGLVNVLITDEEVAEFLRKS